MAFKWVNPGYGELFDIQSAQSYYDKTYSPKNGVCIHGCTVQQSVPNTKEVWLSMTVSFYSIYTFQLYVNRTRGNTCGLNFNTDGQKLEFYNHSKLVATHEQMNFVTGGTTYKIVLHIKSDATDGLMECFVDGKSVLTFTGDVNGGEIINKIYACSDSSSCYLSEFIFSDTDISNENIAIVDLKDLTGTWEGITTGMAKATDAGQTLSHTIDVAKLKDTMAKYSSDATITSIVLSAKDIQYDAEKVNSLTASVISGTSSVFSETKRISGNNTLPQAVYIKNIAADSLSNMKLELKSVKA